jgi:hypothetical protein
MRLVNAVIDTDYAIMACMSPEQPWRESQDDQYFGGIDGAIGAAVAR